jgi:hypothetical protein
VNCLICQSDCAEAATEEYMYSKGAAEYPRVGLTQEPFLSLFLYSDVCTKYQEAAKIVNLALEGIVSQCLPGAKVIDLCEFGHTVITQTAAKVYTKKANGQVIDRGIAFPVCISVNDVVCNHSPLLSEDRVRS